MNETLVQNEDNRSPTADGVPRAAVVAAVSLAVLAIGLAGAARVTGAGNDAPVQSSALVTRTLRFVDRDDGAIVVIDSVGARPVAVVAPGTNGFIRGTMRAMARERRSRHIGSEAPFHLTRWRDGRLTLDDPSTRQHLELTAYGPTNALAYQTLLEAR